MHAWTGAAYELSLGQAHLYWGEELVTAGSEVFEAINSGTAIVYDWPVWADWRLDNSWNDMWAELDLTDYLIGAVPTLGDFIGLQELYSW